MNILPQDLCPETCSQLLKFREQLGVLPADISQIQSAGKKLSASDRGFLTGIWGFALGVGTSLLFQHPAHSFYEPIAVFGGTGAIFGYGSGFAYGSAVNRKSRQLEQIQALTEREIALLNEGVTDELQRDHLKIVSILLTMPTPPNPDTMLSIRNTVRLVGEAIERLPAIPAEGLLLNPQELRDESRLLSAQADDELDTVIKASLQRQASALTRQAETISRTATLVRRNQALRSEVGAQVKAFQTSLAAGQINGIQDTADLAALADHVALIAQETNSLADARSELDTALGNALPIPDTTSPQMMHAGKN